MSWVSVSVRVILCMFDCVCVCTVIGSGYRLGYMCVCMFDRELVMCALINPLAPALAGRRGLRA